MKKDYHNIIVIRLKQINRQFVKMKIFTFFAHKNSSNGATKCRSKYFVILLVKSNLAIFMYKLSTILKKRQKIIYCRKEKNTHIRLHTKNRLPKIFGVRRRNNPDRHSGVTFLFKVKLFGTKDIVCLIVASRQRPNESKRPNQSSGRIILLKGLLFSHGLVRQIVQW